MPCPTEMWLRMKDSPVPAHTMFGSVAATASEPIDATGSESNMGSQCIPPSVLLKMPPEAAPTYQMFGFPGTPATEVARLPSGPMYRYLSCPYTSGLTGGCCACNKAVATNNIATTIRTTYFAETNLSHVNMLDLSVELRKERADDTGGAAAGQCQ